MTERFTWAPGATPLTTEEADGLIPQSVLNRGELDAAEQENILRAHHWIRRRRRDPLTTEFIQGLHRAMFGDVWRWAGTFRRTNKNIGVPWPQISVDLKNLLDDARAWIDHASYAWDELGARFHHRLVFIHCFPNGNGRHARLATNALLSHHGKPPFSWGEHMDAPALSADKPTRQLYITALKKADEHDYAPLIAFVRT